MQLVLHTGAHFTEQERLIKTVRRNEGRFADRGIVVPPPGTYRKLVRDSLNAMDKTPASPEGRQAMLEVMLEEGQADRLVLSDPNFFRTPGTAIQNGVLYPAAAKRLSHMRALFPEDEIEVFLGLRNPATLIPLFHDHAVNSAEEAFWAGRGPRDIRWSDLVAAIQEAVPGVAITVWCAEDLPLIWSQVVREILGFDPQEKIKGGFDLLSTIMAKEGMERLRSYMHANPAISEIQKRRVISAFLDKFAVDEEIEEELDMPGWTEALVEELTEQYDEDVLRISRMPGVTMIAP